MSTLVEQIGQLSPEKIRQIAKAMNARKATKPGPLLMRQPGRVEHPLSFGQERLWFFDQLFRKNTAYNWSFAVGFRFAVDPNLFQRTMTEIVRRHEILRTVYPLADASRAFQRILPPGEARVQILNLSFHERAEAEAQRYLQEDAALPFDLENGPLYRFLLLQIEPNYWIFGGTMHHSITDAWSRKVMMQEMSEIWTAFSLGRPVQLPELPVQYGDYAAWQREWYQGATKEKLLSFWTQQLRDVPNLQLPLDHARPPQMTFHGAMEQISIDKPLASRLRVLGQIEGATPFMTLLAVFQALLARYSGQSDIAVAVPVAGRNHRDVERLIGFFVNTVVMRVDLAGDPTFRELLRRVRQVTIQAFSHQDMPFGQLVEELHPRRDLSRNPLVQVMFQLENIPTEGKDAGASAAVPIDVGSDSALFDFNVHLYENWDSGVLERPEGIHGTLTYNADLFLPETVQRFIAHYESLLRAVADNPDVRVGQLNLLTTVERTQLLSAWNDTAQDEPGTTLPELFKKIVARHTYETACISDGHSLTYSQLNKKANQLAHLLIGAGIGPENFVALALPRSPDLVVAMLGVLKAGAAYMPLDIGHPKEHVDSMLNDARPVLLVATRETQSLLTDRTERQLILDSPDTLRLLCGMDATNPCYAESPRCLNPLNSAYLIYTSGSTGRPKGVIVTHRGIPSLVSAHRDRFGIGPQSRVLQFATPAFDVAFCEIACTLLSGGTLVIPTETQRMGGSLEYTFESLQITHAMLPAALLAGVSHQRSSPANLLIGGEAVSAELAAQWSLGRRLMNVYGVTEATVASTMSDPLSGIGIPPIGKPLRNQKVYVLDSQLQPVPIGVTGELCIAGTGLARGYLNRADLTAASFIAHPFGESGERLYRTGDLVRWSAAGDLEFVGRLDHQVKIRGFRVELGEIESALRRCLNVAEAVVIVREDNPGKKQLIGYVVPVESASVDCLAVRQTIAQSLPEYMVPLAIVEVDSLPKTKTGKLDRDALPKPECALAPWREPSSTKERMLCELFAELLNLPRVGPSDNFFELGGDSIGSIQLVSRAWEAGLAITPQIVFQYQTVEMIAGAATEIEVDEPHGQETASLEPLEIIPREWISAQTSEPAKPSILVPLTDDATGPPIFLVHPAGGNVLCYYHLARHLAGNHSVYGLSSFGIAQEHNLSITKMAADYVAEVQRVQEHGPYVFGGWSAGGVIAFEMARQIEAQQGVQSTVLIFDQPAPLAIFRDTPSLQDISQTGTLAVLAGKLEIFAGRQLGISSDELAGLDDEQQFGLYIERMKAQNMLSSDATADSLRKVLALFKNHVNAIETYSPCTYDGPVILFRSEERMPDAEQEYARAFEDATFGWQALCSSPPMIHRVPGNHLTLISPSNVQFLASAIKPQLGGI